MIDFPNPTSATIIPQQTATSQLLSADGDVVDNDFLVSNIIIQPQMRAGFNSNFVYAQTNVAETASDTLDGVGDVNPNQIGSQYEATSIASSNMTTTGGGGMQTSSPSPAPSPSPSPMSTSGGGSSGY